ncbi:MAG TPA: hypothetical protein VNT32_09380, partial [Thermoleophilaceae bacterium]|nr:hypothetical protein [Thermoleophilaceae bacterium]
MALLLAAGLVFHAGHSLGLGGPQLDSLADDWVYNGLIVGAAGVCLAAGRRAGGHRVAWLALGAGIALWAGGEILYSLQYDDAGEVPIPSASDAFWLAFYPCVFVAVAVLAREQRRPLDLDLWLDGAIAASAAAAGHLDHRVHEDHRRDGGRGVGTRCVNQARGEPEPQGARRG